MHKNKGGRHYWFADNLAKNGYNPVIFCSNQFHETTDQIDLENKKYKIDGSGKFPFVFVKSSPYKGNGISRIFNMFSFYKNLLSITKNYVKQHEKPDVILASSVHPLTLVAGIKIAKRYKIPCICEMRDLWPEAIFEYGALKKNSLIGKILRLGEKWIYKRANALIFTKEGDTDYLKERKWDSAQGGAINLNKCHYINNGVDLEAFDYNKEYYITNDDDLENDDVFKVIYTGAIRKVNNLRIIVEVAKELKDNDEVKFLIWGNGDELEELKMYVKQENLKNISFKGYVEKKYIPYILSKSSVNMLHYQYTPILRFGTSENKIFDYLASGKPVLRTMKTNYDFITESNSGKSIEEQTIDNIKNAVLDFYKMAYEQKELYNEMCINARKTAEEYDFKLLTKKLIEIIEEQQ